MKTQLPELHQNLRCWSRAGEFEPDPLSYDEGLPEDFRRFGFQSLKQVQRGLHLCCFFCAHYYSLFRAVHLRKQVAFGWITLAEGTDGPLFAARDFSWPQRAGVAHC